MHARPLHAVQLVGFKVMLKLFILQKVWSLKRVVVNRVLLIKRMHEGVLRRGQLIFKVLSCKEMIVHSRKNILTKVLYK